MKKVEEKLNDFESYKNGLLTIEEFQTKYPSVNIKDLDIIYESKETFRHIAEMLRVQELTTRTKRRVEDFVALLMIHLSSDMDVQYTEFAERRIVKIPNGKLSYNKHHPYKLIRVSLKKEVSII